MVKIVLHQWEISPFCHKVRKILKYKHLKYSVINYNGLLASQVAKLSKVGKLPVLDYDSDRIQDSSDIAAFLDQRHPDPPLFPTGEKAKLEAYFWEDWADEALYWYEVYLRFMNSSALHQSLELLCAGRSSLEKWLVSQIAPYLYKSQLRAQGLGRLELHRVEAKFFQHLVHLDQILQHQPWLVGDELTIADIAVAAQLEEVLRTSPLKDRILQYSYLANWLQQQR